MDNDNITTVDTTVVEPSDEVLEGNTTNDTTCTICESIDYTEQLEAINNGIYSINVFIACFVTFYVFNYFLHKFVIKRSDK